MANTEYLEALAKWREAVLQYEEAMRELRIDPSGQKRELLLIARHKMREASSALEGLDLYLDGPE